MGTSRRTLKAEQPLASWLALLDHLMEMSDGINDPAYADDQALVKSLMRLAAVRIDELSGANSQPTPKKREGGQYRQLRNG